MALRRAIATGGTRTLAGRLAVAERGNRVWLQPANGDPSLALAAGPAERALHNYAGSPALLVWTRRRRGPAALVLPDRAVVYLSRSPGGIRAAAGQVGTTDEAGWTLPVRS
jgi:hypothetical protein